eukprot:c26390_g1_i3 orf=347-607(-)
MLPHHLNISSFSSGYSLLQLAKINLQAPSLSLFGFSLCFLPLHHACCISAPLIQINLHTLNCINSCAHCINLGTTFPPTHLIESFF